MKDTFVQDDFLQDWDDFEDIPENDGDEWKYNRTKEMCKQLFKKWESISFMLRGLLLSEEDVSDDIHFASGMVSEMIISNAIVVQVKLRGCYNATSYSLLMENAAIIRSEAQAIKTQLLTLQMMDKSTEAHVTILRNEIDEFRAIFKDWVTTFTKDGNEDEWGLFI